ncbi:unnamed protein product [Paramecium sonneborni]|uniref:Transmembrane protein n=1 Tax=Paramecium sonneborni TaxID=65129 RepID=A0A8S1KP43_9CILI|nr:unnamed protein product [Paramecium sonneborni]
MNRWSVLKSLRSASLQNIIVLINIIYFIINIQVKTAKTKTLVTLIENNTSFRQSQILSLQIGQKKWIIYQYKRIKMLALLYLIIVIQDIVIVMLLLIQIQKFQRTDPYYSEGQDVIKINNNNFFSNEKERLEQQIQLLRITEVQLQFNRLKICLLNQNA